MSECSVLTQTKCGVAKEMIDAEELGESSSLCIASLARGYHISQSAVITIDNFFQEGFVETMRRAVEAQSGRRETPGEYALSVW